MIDRGAWNCTDENWVAHEPVAWLRFEIDAGANPALAEKPPAYFYSRIARHESITFMAVDDQGRTLTARYTENDAQPRAAGPVFELPLPKITEETKLLLVRIERPHSVPLLTEARITHYSGDTEWSQIEVMLLAMVFGMLILPLLFDLTAFAVLRERFVLLHAGMVFSMMAYVLCASGLISAFVTLPLVVLAIVGPLAWTIGTGLSALFFVEFLGRDAQSPFMRKVTLGIGYWTLAVPSFCALQLHATQSFDDRIYFASFLPIIIIMTVAIIEAMWRGSRGARFLALAWTPIILASIERLLRGLGVYVGPSELDQSLFLATGLEVIVISLAIADRFLAIRRERDEALTQAIKLGQLSEHDALTGLLNRRVIDTRIDDLREQGFDTFALIDLDRFKSVNDRFGHQIGDEVLISCAEAIRDKANRDTVAMRLGGEEFGVLLRGAKAIERAEALRQAIPLRVARDVESLDRPVTASMGVVELPKDAHGAMSFEEFYARADKLLYEAKASGRNRMLYERLRVFTSPPSQRPVDAAA